MAWEPFLAFLACLAFLAHCFGCPWTESKVDLEVNESWGGKGCPTQKKNSSVYPSIRAFSTPLAVREVPKNIPAPIAISARSARPRAARFAKELAGNLKSSFPSESRSLSSTKSTLKNNPNDCRFKIGDCRLRNNSDSA